MAVTVQHEQDQLGTGVDEAATSAAAAAVASTDSAPASESGRKRNGLATSLRTNRPELHEGRGRERYVGMVGALQGLQLPRLHHAGDGGEHAW